MRLPSAGHEIELVQRLSLVFGRALVIEQVNADVAVHFNRGRAAAGEKEDLAGHPTRRLVVHAGAFGGFPQTQAAHGRVLGGRCWKLRLVREFGQQARRRAARAGQQRDEECRVPHLTLSNSIHDSSFWSLDVHCQRSAIPRTATHETFRLTRSQRRWCHSRRNRRRRWLRVKRVSPDRSRYNDLCGST